jgi:hypothetical protein
MSGEVGKIRRIGKEGARGNLPRIGVFSLPSFFLTIFFIQPLGGNAAFWYLCWAFLRCEFARRKDVCREC